MTVMLNKFMTVSPSSNRPSAGALRSIVKTMSMSVCFSPHENWARFNVPPNTL